MTSCPNWRLIVKGSQYNAANPQRNFQLHPTVSTFPRALCGKSMVRIGSSLFGSMISSVFASFSPFLTEQWSCVKSVINTVYGRNPAPPWMVETCWNPINHGMFTTYQLVFNSQATVAALGTRGQHPITAAPHVRGAALNGRMDVHVETRWEVLIDRSLGEVPKFVEKETQLQIQEYHHLSP